jgi:Flp pilus assembly protein TadB
MSGNERGAITGWVATMLAAVVALYIAVHLIELIAPALFVIAAVGAVVYVVVLFVRRRCSGW